MSENEKKNLEDCKLDDSEVLQVSGGVENEPELSEDEIRIVDKKFEPKIFIKH